MMCADLDAVLALVVTACVSFVAWWLFSISCEACDEFEKCLSRKEDLLSRLAITEETNAALFNNDPAPKEECQICCLPMPFVAAHPITQATYMPCCGCWECEGCSYADSEHSSQCPFCRASLAYSPKEGLERCKKRAEANDAEGIHRLGVYHSGYRGLPKDMNMKKAAELFERAAELGSVHARYSLAVAYLQGNGVEEDHCEALHHFRLAAIQGHEEARRWVGNCERDLGFPERAMKHWMIAASLGYEKALTLVSEGYRSGQVAKDDYAKTLRAFKDSQDEMNSEQRAEAAAARASLISEEGGGVVHPSRTDIIDPNRTGGPPTYAEKTGRRN